MFFAFSKFTIQKYTRLFAHSILQKIGGSGVGARLAYGTFWAFLGALISRGLLLCATILSARILGKTEFGELGVVQSTIGMFGVFAGFGLGLTATKYVAEHRQRNPERAGRIIGISSMFAVFTGGIMAGILFIFAPWLAENTLNAPHLAGALRISAIMLFLSAINGMQTGTLSGLEAFKTIAIVNLVSGLLSFPILIAGAYLGGVTGAVWAMAANLAIGWLLNHLAMRREAGRFGISLSWRDCGSELPVLWKFSLPATLASSLVGPVNWICITILVSSPRGYEEMGIYNAANQWYMMILFLPSVLGNVVLPMLTDQIARDEIDGSNTTLFLSIRANLLVTFPLVLAACLASPFIMSLYGDGFASGWPTLVVVLITAGILVLQVPVGQIIAASGKMWLGFTMNMGWAAIFVIGALLLAPQGSLGLATARCIAYVFHGLWTFGFVFLWLKR